mgnify:CR=1 FL=1
MPIEKIFIKNFAYCNAVDEIIKKIPMMMRRKLSTVDKLAMSVILKVYEENDNIDEFIFSSQYGEFERLFSLIEQYNNENEVSPIAFSASVHNYLAGVLSLFKNLTGSYYAVSSGENSLSFGLVEAIVSGKNNILYCYSDSFEEKKSVAVLISKTPVLNSIEYKFDKEINSTQGDEYSLLIDFLENRTSKFVTPVGILSKVDV